MRLAVYSQWCECMLPYNIEGSVTFQGLRACGTQPMCVICSFYYHNLGGCIVYVSYLQYYYFCTFSTLVFLVFYYFSCLFLHIYYLCVYVCVFCFVFWILFRRVQCFYIYTSFTWEGVLEHIIVQYNIQLYFMPLHQYSPYVCYYIYETATSITFVTFQTVHTVRIP